MADSDPTRFYRTGGREPSRQTVVHNVSLADCVDLMNTSSNADNGQPGAITGPIFNQYPYRLCRAHCPIAKGDLPELSCTLLHSQDWHSVPEGTTSKTRYWSASVTSPYSNPDRERNYDTGTTEDFQSVFDVKAKAGKIPCQTGPTIFIDEVKRQLERDAAPYGTPQLNGGQTDDLFSL